MCLSNDLHRFITCCMSLSYVLHVFIICVACVYYMCCICLSYVLHMFIICVACLACVYQNVLHVYIVCISKQPALHECGCVSSERHFGCVSNERHFQTCLRLCCMFVSSFQCVSSCLRLRCMCVSSCSILLQDLPDTRRQRPLARRHRVPVGCP